ncbi:MAG: PCYCGC domain-containing protein [Chloroflexota bacterium]|nr:PCYCGC domain-containing protein [Chloroflexota bacterium]
MGSVPVGKAVKGMAPRTVERRRGVSPLTRVAIMLLLPVIVGALIACDNGSGGTQQVARAPYEGIPEGKPKGLNGSVPNPKEVLETAAAGQLPNFLQDMLGPNKEAVTTLYQGAMQHYDEFGYIPCYCGCAIYEQPHQDLAQCFIKSMSPDGSAEFTDHSTTCSQCQEAAEMTIDGLAQGTPLKDIRAAVFNKLNYTQIWTDTPPVP